MTTHVRRRVLTGRPPEPGRPRSRWFVLAVLCLALLMVNLDSTVLNVALPPLVRNLGAATTELQWIVDAHVLVFAGLLLVAGSVADRIGRKRVFCAGLAAFAARSSWAGCASSSSFSQRSFSAVRAWVSFLR
jgi:MFS family permease